LQWRWRRFRNGDRKYVNPFKEPIVVA